MAIKDLPKYKDIRNTIRRSGRYPYVGTAVKDTIVIHHSLTAMKLKGSTPEAFANTHIDSNGWHGCAYPFVITWDGTIYQTDDLDRRTYHAGNTNTRSIGVCVAGDFRKGKEKPTQEQMESLYLLVEALQEELPKLKIILGHQECPGYSWKNCPGDGWDFRKVIDGTLVSADDAAHNLVPTKTEKLPDAYVVQEGDTFWSISRELEGVTLDEIQALNPGVDPKNLKVGQTLKLVKTPAPAGTVYTVKSGDTLWGVARAFKGVEVADIQKANNLKSDILQPGQQLKIPTATVKAAAAKPAEKPAPKPAPAKPAAPKKDYVHFPPNKGSWNVYPLTKAPKKGNEVGEINPTKFGGLDYEILGRPYPNVVTINTSSWGKVNVFVGDSDSKEYKK